MLTLESFNALLENTGRTAFIRKIIFSTTDPHKIPQTIIFHVVSVTIFLRIPIKNDGGIFLKK
jgi:hypothetical protein